MPGTLASTTAGISTSAFAQPKAYPCPIAGDFKPVDIPVGLLCDYYEHGIEHMPPRNPSGVMQHRERFYAAPSDPTALIEPGISGADQDQRLADEFKKIVGNWQTGKTPGLKQLASLEKPLSISSVACDRLIETGRAMTWLGGDEVAALFFRVGLAKALNQYAAAPAGDTTALPLLRAIDQTKSLWRQKAWSILEQRFRLTRALSVPLSPESRRAGHLIAEMLYYQERYREASELIETVFIEHQKVGDLGSMDHSDFDEIAWVRGLFDLQANRLSQAEACFDECVRLRGAHAEQASINLIRTYLAENRTDDASRRLNSHIVTYAPSQKVVDHMRSLIQSQLMPLPTIPDFKNGGTEHD